MPQRGPKDWKPYSTKVGRDLVWVAQMSTESFEWIAIGRTAAEAARAMAARWDEHAGQRSLVSWDEGMGNSHTVGEYYGMWLRPLKIGRGYMDGDSE